MDEHYLRYLYEERRYSMKQIADILGFSVHKIEYWMKKHCIQIRSRSGALYVRNNQHGDPFCIKPLELPFEYSLYGLGIGIFWGEGNKKDKNAVRVGNTDPGLILTFVKFLEHICGVKKEKIRFGLQLFSDVSEDDAINFWINMLKIEKSSLMPTVSRIKSGKIGTYKTRNQYGVMTVYVCNTKLRNWMIEQLHVPR